MFHKLPKWIVNEFIYGGHLLSLGASAIVWATIILADKSVSSAWPILFLAYLSSQIVYNYDHLVGINDDLANNERSKHLRETKKYQITSLSAYLVLFIVTTFFTSIPAAFIAVLIVAGGIFYTKKAKKFTRNILGFKNYYIAFFWSILALLVPYHFNDNSQWILIMFFALFIYIRWIVNTVFFDLKDADDDKKKGLKTLPAVYGFNKTISYLYPINMLSGIVILLGVFLNYLPKYSFVLIIFTLYSFYYLSKSKTMTEKQLRILSYVMVDGEYLIWPLLLFIAKNLLS